MERQPSVARDLIALIRWIRLIRSVAPDVTLIGTPKAALLGHFAGRICGVPRRIYSLFGLRVETATGVMNRLLITLERATIRNSTEVISVSHSVEKLAVEMGLMALSKSTVLGLGSCNGVDVRRHRALAADTERSAALRKSLGVVDGVPVIGFVGRLTRDKGLPELAKALRLLKERGVEAQLLAIGGVDDESGQTALHLLEATGQLIVSTGYIEDTAPYYALMDVFCLPSLREELPNVVL